MKLKKIYGILALTSALASMSLLGACMGTSGTTLVNPVNEPEFQKVVSLLRPLMIENNIMDSEGAWEKPRFFSIHVEGAGSILLNRLSPAFRFPATDPAYIGKTLKDMVNTDSRVAVAEDSVTIIQGLDKMTTSLIAVMDWNKDGRDDWLVIARIEPMNIRGASREYYLLIENTDAPVLTPRILAIQDCREGRCELYRNAGETSLLIDFNTTDLVPGEHQVTVHPEQVSQPQNQGDITESSLAQ